MSSTVPCVAGRCASSHASRPPTSSSESSPISPPRRRLRTPSTRPTTRARATSRTAERARGRTLGLAITRHFLTPHTRTQQLTLRLASLEHRLARSLPPLLRCPHPCQAPKCTAMTANRLPSVPSPTDLWPYRFPSSNADRQVVFPILCRRRARSGRRRRRDERPGDGACAALRGRDADLQPDPGRRDRRVERRRGGGGIARARHRPPRALITKSAASADTAPPVA